MCGEIVFKTEELTQNFGFPFFEYRYVYKDKNLSGKNQASPDSENRILGIFHINDLISKVFPKEAETLCVSKDFYFYASGWQSWGFGGELAPGEIQKKYFPIVPQWKNYISFPGKEPKKVMGKKSSSSKVLKGQFIIYFRWENNYLVLASSGNIGPDENLFPPVQFYVDRKSRSVTPVIYSEGKSWQDDECAAKISVFSASSFFELKERIAKLFGSSKNSRFDSLRFLSADSDKILTAGWESWYNHYADINTKLINEDLHALGKTDNIINAMYTKENKPVVFQVDDGWEAGLGQWEVWKERFPEGMENLASSISAKGYIPGLWIAPFIVDWRSPFAQSHKDWILKDKKGKPLAAGMNPLWGAAFGKNQPALPYSYFCLDLSRDDVLEYLDSLMDKVVNVWGFRYIKLDFLFAGMLKGNFAKGGAAYVWYDRALKVLTKRKANKSGKNVAYLGCGMPFEASYRCLPLSRIGPDTKEDWDVPYLRRANFTARTSAYLNMKATLGHAFWDQAVYINDPDVIFLRYENISLSDTEKELVALVNRLFASQLMHSDDPVHFSPASDGAFTNSIIDLYKKFDDQEFGHYNLTSDTYIIFSKSKKYCGFINVSEKPVTFSQEELYRLAGIGANKELVPLVEHCLSAAGIYTQEKHSISIFEVK